MRVSEVIGGVYAITNTVTGDRYIGGSWYVSSRWAAHRAALRRGRHVNAKLQAAWIFYGEAAFVFELLEQTTGRSQDISSETHHREMWWIAHEQPTYNIPQEETSQKQRAYWERRRNERACE